MTQEVTYPFSYWGLCICTTTRKPEWQQFLFSTCKECGQKMDASDSDYVRKLQKKNSYISVSFYFEENTKLIEEYTKYNGNCSNYVLWGLTNTFNRLNRNDFFVLLNRSVFRDAFQNHNNHLKHQLKSLIAHELAHCFDIHLHGFSQPEHGYDWYQISKILDVENLDEYARRIRKLKKICT